ncbi:hypothetical protein ONS96_000895 [Cadophora gregata f. sp. sojae]|nr:hypothetical protein ONS96_000895 [Cadophora gregata f. sp. sojae]
MCLRALDVLPEALEARKEAGKLYRQLLAGVPGVTFQQIPAGLGTNHYQVSATIDAKSFGLSARRIYDALKAENVHCSADRMPCVAVNGKFSPHGSVGGDLKHSQMLATTSITLPISNSISLGTVRIICDLIKLIQRCTTNIREKRESDSARDPPSESADVIDLESKFRQHLTIPVLDDASVHSKFLVPRNYLPMHDISVDEFLERLKSQQQWSRGECVFKELRVDAIIGGAVILAPHSAGQPLDAINPVALDESGSSANVTLVPGVDGLVTVRKSASGYGIDGNGAPWLRRQSLFLRSSRAVKKTRMFVVPDTVTDNSGNVILVLPYIPSHSFVEMVFANVGAESIVKAVVNMFSRMATSVWTEGQEECSPYFIQKAHFARMRRRLKIARQQDKTLDRILKQETVILNGRRLSGFETVMKKLECHPRLAKISPKILGEIHGDLNIHNVLSRLDPEEDEPLALIDPRGVSLLGSSDDKTFERGDYCYDISKLLFSLTGFSEIRKRFFDYSADDDSHKLTIQNHPGSDTMNGAAHMLIPALAANTLMKQWIHKVEHDGVRSFELRLRVGEAAHFVSDSACALGRDTPWEIVPLFLMGLEKLNDVIDLLEGEAELCINNAETLSGFECVPTGAEFGIAMIYHVLFDSQASNTKWPYDVLELSVENESVSTLQKLLCEMVGTYLPKRTAVFISTDPGECISNFPCVVIHPSNGVRGQTHMLAAATRRTIIAFFRDCRVPQWAIENLRIVHVSSTGSSSRSQLTARDNDKLLSPGIFGISPLHLALLQANQLPFPKPGRWVVENDSFFLLSKPLAMGGNELCLLAIERPKSSSSLSWRVCVDNSEQRDGLLLAKSFRDIGRMKMERG